MYWFNTLIADQEFLVLDEVGKNELAFIKTNSVLINVLYDLYFNGTFSTSGGPEAENKQNSLEF